MSFLSPVLALVLSFTFLAGGSVYANHDFGQYYYNKTTLRGEFPSPVSIPSFSVPFSIPFTVQPQQQPVYRQPGVVGQPQRRSVYLPPPPVAPPTRTCDYTSAYSSLPGYRCLYWGNNCECMSYQYFHGVPTTSRDYYPTSDWRYRVSPTYDRRDRYDLCRYNRNSDDDDSNCDYFRNDSNFDDDFDDDNYDDDSFDDDDRFSDDDWDSDDNFDDDDFNNDDDD